MAREPFDFTAAPLRGRMEAWLLDAAAEPLHRQHGERKSRLLGPLDGTIVEIGAGTGANLRYYRPGVHLVAVEPNPAMHARLLQKAERFDLDLELRATRGEHLDLEDASADAVVGTLVLCGVDDPGRVVAEVKRVLRPGAPYVFFEHVAAPEGSFTRRLQSWVRRPHRWVFNGCEVDRDTGALLARAGFDDVQVEALDDGPLAGYVRHGIAGVATR